MTPEVAQAAEEIKSSLPENRVGIEEECQGGAYVTVYDVPLTSKYLPETSWFAFLISFQYPDADVYPHFIEACVKRRDGNPLGQGFADGSWQGAPAVQISRRSNRLNPQTDTAAIKLLKVIAWVREQ